MRARVCVVVGVPEEVGTTEHGRRAIHTRCWPRLGRRVQKGQCGHQLLPELTAAVGCAVGAAGCVGRRTGAQTAFALRARQQLAQDLARLSAHLRQPYDASQQPPHACAASACADRAALWSRPPGGLSSHCDGPPSESSASMGAEQHDREHHTSITASLCDSAAACSCCECRDRTASSCDSAAATARSRSARRGG
jgi:hypothetical protein